MAKSPRIETFLDDHDTFENGSLAERFVELVVRAEKTRRDAKEAAKELRDFLRSYDQI